MAAVNMSVKHGQSWDEARANFEKGVSTAQSKYGRYLRSVEWSDDRTEARLTGPGFHVDLRVDPESVHAAGEVPWFVKMLEPQVRKFIEHTLESK